MKSFIQLFLALVAHSASHPLLAQRVEAGARVRIETRDGLVRTGDVIDLHADSLTVKLDRTGASLTVDQVDVRFAEVSIAADRKRSATRGAMVAQRVGCRASACRCDSDEV